MFPLSGKLFFYHFPDDAGDPVRVGIIKLLQRITGRRWNIRQTDTAHRSLEIVEPLLGGKASDFGADPAHGPARINNHEPSRLVQGFGDNALIQRLETTQIDDLRLNAL